MVSLNQKGRSEPALLKIIANIMIWSFRMEGPAKVHPLGGYLN